MIALINRPSWNQSLAQQHPSGEKRADFVKIDVEHLEPVTLDGLRQTIAR